MQTNVLEYLEETVKRVPDKMAFADDEICLSFQELYDRAGSVGTRLANQGAMREAVIVYMKKSPCTLSAFFGVIYSGCFYVPIDEEMPRRRMELILENTQALFISNGRQRTVLKFCGFVLSIGQKVGI